MNSSISSNPRLHAWPKVIEDSEGTALICAKFLTPLRLCFLQELIYLPLIVIWRYALLAYLGYAGLAYLGAFKYDFRYSHAEALGLLLIPVALWYGERIARFPLSRIAAGTTVRVTITKREVIVKIGAFSSHSYPRQQVGFAMQPFDGAVTPAFQRSKQLCLVVGNIRRIILLEAYEGGRVSDFVDNVTAALMSPPNLTEREINETRRENIRLQSRPTATSKASKHPLPK